VSNFQIKLATNEQLHDVHRIMREAFEEYRGKLIPESGALSEEVEDTRNKLSKQGGAILVWDEELQVGSAQYVFKDEYMYIGRVSIIKQARGQGLGKAIMSYLEELAKGRGVNETQIEVRLSLPANIAFYTQLGYTVVEARDYPDKTDGWYIMSKKLL
jgi:ribosomal protein S18 acetylase RimI-like enzyme